MIKVFISSTSEDLKSYRQGAIDVCNQLGLSPVAMEYFGASEEDAIKKSLNELRSAKIYLGIYAYRYGSIIGGRQKSITELEYEEAGNLGIDRLCFIANSKHPWPPENMDSDQTMIGIFKNTVASQHICGQFTSVDNFKSILLQSLVEWLRKNPANADIYELFADAPSLSKHIRIREFKNLIEGHTQGFVGRDFIFKAITDFIDDEKFSSGYIVISGEPGIGKTALLAQMVKKTGYVHHFNIALQNIRSIPDFLGNICAQLIVRYHLKHPDLPPEATRDGGFLAQLLDEVIEKEENRPLVILIDAIDESEDTGKNPNANRLYLPPILPKGVFFILTTREQADYRLLVDNRKDIYLGDKDPLNLQDVRQYISKYINDYQEEMILRIQPWKVTRDEFETVLTELSEGNFMYLVHVLRDIREGILTAENIEDIRKLPKGLKEYYQRHWRAMKAQDRERFEKYYQPVVCILATVKEPVTLAKVVEWTKLSPIQVKEVIDKWREFLNTDETAQAEPLYRVYHKSFQDFLEAEVGLKHYHECIVKSALDKIPGFYDEEIS